MSAAPGAGGAPPDFVRAPNQADRPEVYELENTAMDPSGLVLDALRELAPWRGRRLLDLGCGAGYWLPGYTAEAAEVVGVEPDPSLLPLAAARPGGARVLQGSAEHLPLPDASVDVVHARFAYFFPPGCDAGLAEVRRVLRPGGSLVVVDNDHRAGEFAELLAASPWAAYQGAAGATDAWWAQRGAVRREVMSSWDFQRRADLQAVLRLEFPPQVAGPWLAAHPGALSLSYGYVLFCVTA
ncbi:class I SAM-dependent methyltransferase [Quadrisphaera oryzae]|uniref:class I SAM-dependent methyltransferase n=1 Tax=Quadrisphaera TaxID=317661 RepID=UPI00351C6AF6